MKLYTKTICPKCMFVKFQLKQAGLEGIYEEINIDSNEQERKRLVNAGFTTVPILEIEGKLIPDVKEIDHIISKMYV